MKDNFGREIEYLRLSVTNKCNLSCSYCKHIEIKGRELITLEEIKNIVLHFSKGGIKKIRLTGGEPLTREDICEIISLCKNEYKIKDLALTTNGVLLAKKAALLREAGLDRVNISIDSLKPSKYQDITKANSLQLVLDGIDAAIAVGLLPLKINVVLMRGKNDDEIDDFINLAKDKEIEVRFIEYMPMGKDISKNVYISKQEVLTKRKDLILLEKNGVAENYGLKDYKGKIGFISPISQPFCSECNKVRVTPDCYLRFCLGDNFELDLREILDKENAFELIEDAIKQKPIKGFCSGFQTNRGMRNIGG